MAKTSTVLGSWDLHPSTGVGWEEEKHLAQSRSSGISFWALTTDVHVRYQLGQRCLDEWSQSPTVHPSLFLVDGVSSICALDFRMDEWGIDVALTCSQKALSLPLGMGISLDLLFEEGLDNVIARHTRLGKATRYRKLLGCPAGVEMILKDVGYPIILGSGVAAACAYLQNNVPMIPSRV
ncbi:hypothetical protein IFM89_032171 [Coptis chinensis]|uniref:Aminotransferase class V domain-containing protein n=1 Tax=Coptis chinensis TaxID=261450 RepID=A0A835J127_9MAGN|nr:hypothetical protein IFM89_032171 [Coptis chinensis]